MKKAAIFIASLALLVGFFLPAQAFAQAEVPIYRVYNTKSGEHLYTISTDEVAVLTSQGWKDEGIGWFSPSTGTPVYRIFNPKSEHLYTTDTNEVNVLTSQQGWIKDFNGEPIFYSGGDVSVYRLFNTGAGGRHHLTTDANEYNVLGSSGWNQEGVAFNALKVGLPAGAEPTTEVPSGSATISNTPAAYAIEANVNLSGSGTGYHAKLLGVTPSSAVSFGIQFDTTAPEPYKGKGAFMIENVASNNAGGQTYEWAGIAPMGQTHRIMLAFQNDGTVDAYVNGAKVKTVQNPQLAGQLIALRVEGSARKNGDSVNAQFSDIKVKTNGEIRDLDRVDNVFKTNPGINVDTSSFGSSHNVSISGTISGLSGNQDWDNAYGDVSGIVQFNS